jgi:hypothetical protein
MLDRMIWWEECSGTGLADTYILYTKTCISCGNLDGNAIPHRRATPRERARDAGERKKRVVVELACASLSFLWFANLGLPRVRYQAAI